MEEINFNGLNYNDSHLGDQINQALNEYNSLAKKISESKRDFAYKDPNKLNNYYNKYEFNLINKRNLHISLEKEMIFIIHIHIIEIIIEIILC